MELELRDGNGESFNVLAGQWVVHYGERPSAGEEGQETHIDWVGMTMEERQEARRILQGCWDRLQALLDRVKGQAVGTDEYPAQDT